MRYFARAARERDQWPPLPRDFEARYQAALRHARATLHIDPWAQRLDARTVEDEAPGVGLPTAREVSAAHKRGAVPPGRAWCRQATRRRPA